MNRRLFTPGPIDVDKDVLQEMLKPMIRHRSLDASLLQESISRKVQILFNTEDQILLSTSSGSGLMEGAIRSCTRKRAAIFSIGAFGDRWHNIALCNNIPADKFRVEDGEAISSHMVEEVLSTGNYDLITITHNETSTGVTNPLEEIAKVINRYPDIIWCLDTVSSMGGIKIDVDELGVDICITSTQKAIGVPPGLAIASMSERAVKAAEKVKYRGSYFDLLELYKYIREKNYQYPSTPAISIMYALDYQLEKLLDEGLKNRYKRHADMARHVQSWARKNFAIFPNENYLSNTLTVIRNIHNIDIEKLNKKLEERAYVISNGYGALKDKTFRISHMGDYRMKDVCGLTNSIDNILKTDWEGE